jgi:hypothetical protein
MSIVRCLFEHLVARCEERGYDIHNVMPCIVNIEGDYIYVDTEHMAYPAAKRTPAEIEAQAKRVQEYYDNFNKQIVAQAGINREQREEAQRKYDELVRNAKPIPNFGPGTELKKLLAKVGIKATPTCSCNKRAQVMDEKGAQWCRENIDTIVGWLREESEKRGLPFVDLAGKLLVKRAISLAEKAEKKRKQEEEKQANG